MPIYEFKCNQCGKEFEEIVFSFDKDREVCCPSCKTADTCRLMSSFSCASSSGEGAGKGASSHSCASHGGFS
jgi:putative FmdB family regulatory protein